MAPLPSVPPAITQKYKGLAQAHLQDGKTISLCNDLWNGQLLAVNNPELFSFAIHKNIIVKKAIQEENMCQLFSLPLSETAYQQLQDMFDSVTVTEDRDVWTCIWG